MGAECLCVCVRFSIGAIWMLGAEMLKYFYLLFCDPGVVSLDDYMLYVSFLSLSLSFSL